MAANNRRPTVAGTAADPLVKYHAIELDGETYKLAFDFNSIATAETLCGANLLQALDLKGLTANQYRGIFYASLMKAHPRMTLEGAGKLVTLPNLDPITEGLFAAWRLAMPAKEESEEGNEEAASESAA